VEAMRPYTNLRFWKLSEWGVISVVASDALVVIYAACLPQIYSEVLTLSNCNSQLSESRKCSPRTLYKSPKICYNKQEQT